jgi:D-alanyl-D-alanine carboxypeptidase
MSYNWAGSGVISTAADVTTFFRALLGGRLLPDELLAKMKSNLTKPFGASVAVAYGLGLMKRMTNCGPSWGHTGLLFGFQTTASDGRFSNVSIVIATELGRVAPAQFTVNATGSDSIKSAQAPIEVSG